MRSKRRHIFKYTYVYAYESVPQLKASHPGLFVKMLSNPLSISRGDNGCLIQTLQLIMLQFRRKSLSY
jgi:hypothetical protein